MASQNGALKVALVAGATTTTGFPLAVENTSGEDRIITSFIVDITTVSTGAATMDFGVGATASTNNASLIDGVDVNSATGTFDLVIDAGTDGKNARRWNDGTFVNAKNSADTTGLVGNVYIQYIVV